MKKNWNIAVQPLDNQRLATTLFRTPSEVVNWLGAVQSQDLLGWLAGDRGADGTDKRSDERAGNVFCAHTIVIDGRVLGRRKRTFQKISVRLESKRLAPLSKIDQRAFNKAVECYAAFPGLPIEWV